VYIHLYLDVPVNEHVKFDLAKDAMDDEVAGPRFLLTAPRGVLPPPSWPPTYSATSALWAPSAAASPDERAAAE
jgi:hypothetical protein